MSNFRRAGRFMSQWDRYSESRQHRERGLNTIKVSREAEKRATKPQPVEKPLWRPRDIFP